MILQYLKESLRWIHLFFLKPITFMEEAKRLSINEEVVVYLKVLPVGLVIILALEIAVGVCCEFAGISFNWSETLRYTLFGGLVVGLFVGLFVVLFVGLGGGLVFGLFVALLCS